MITLRCERLSKAFGGVCALTNFDFQFPTTGITSIIGPNGAGKTTLLNILTGFLRPDSGHCYLDAREITNLVPHRITRLGLTRTFQELKLIGAISALDNVMLARPKQKGEKVLRAVFGIGVPQDEARNLEEAFRLLHFVGLEEKASEYAGELSYGQQKLLTLACCLATEPQILLLDEPIAGIHPDMVNRVLNLLTQLRDQGRLIIFIEHDIAAVCRVADTLLVMDQGKLIAQGSPLEVLKRPEIMEAYLA